MGRLLKAFTVIVFAATVSAAAAQEPRTIENVLSDYSRNPMNPEMQGKSRDYYINSRCAGLMVALPIAAGQDVDNAGQRAAIIFTEMSVIMLERDHLRKGGRRNYDVKKFRQTATATVRETATRYVLQLDQHGFADGSAIKRDIELCQDKLPVAKAIIEAAGRSR